MAATAAKVIEESAMSGVRSGNILKSETSNLDDLRLSQHSSYCLAYGYECVYKSNHPQQLEARASQLVTLVPRGATVDPFDSLSIKMSPGSFRLLNQCTNISAITKFLTETYPSC